MSDQSSVEATGEVTEIQGAERDGLKYLRVTVDVPVPSEVGHLFLETVTIRLARSPNP